MTGLKLSSHTHASGFGKGHDSEETHKFPHSVSLDGFALHVQVPDFDREVVPRDHVTARVGELDVGDGGDYLGEEAAIRRVLGLLEHCNERDAFSPRFLLLLETTRRAVLITQNR